MRLGKVIARLQRAGVGLGAKRRLSGARVKSGCGSLRLSRHWLPQLPALRAAAAGLDDAGSTGGLALPRAFPSNTTSHRAACRSHRPPPPAAEGRYRTRRGFGLRRNAARAGR